MGKRTRICSILQNVNKILLTAKGAGPNGSVPFFGAGIFYLVLVLVSSTVVGMGMCYYHLTNSPLITYPIAVNLLGVWGLVSPAAQLPLRYKPTKPEQTMNLS
jgi:hypothetical protein